MKKLFFLAAVLTAFVANSFATPSKAFTSGIMFTEGVEISRGDAAPSMDELNGYRMTTALTYNAMIGIIPSLYIHPAIGLNLRWCSESSDDNNNNSSGFNFSASSNDDRGIVALDIELPVTARYYISNVFFAELGLEFDFNLLEKGYDEERSWNNDDARLFNMGVVAGLGVTLNFGLEIGLTYVHGFTDLYKQHTLDLGPIHTKSATWSYSRINFNIGYWFGYR